MTRRPGTPWYSFERLEDRTLLAVLTVNTAADDTTNDAFLTLREAIAVVNDGNHLDGVTGLGGRMLSAGELAQLNLTNPLGTSDEVLFDAAAVNASNPVNLEGTTLGDIDIFKAVDIIGNGAADTVIDAQSQSRIFDISTSTVSLSGLTLQNGNVAGAGGAIRATTAGTLSISDSVLTGNQSTGVGNNGGAIYSGLKDLVITNSVFEDNSSESKGGAVYGYRVGSMSISRSTLSGNSTNGVGGKGGAVWTYFGALTVTASALDGNQTYGTSSEGGAIYSRDAAVNMINCTLSANAVNGTGGGGGAIYSRNGAVTLVHSTVHANSANVGGGISFQVDSAGEALKVVNSIIAGNTATTNPDFLAPGTPGTNLRVRNSLIGRNDGTTLTADATATFTDAVQSASFVGGGIGAGLTAAQIGLGPLQSNGGLTVTHALLATSLALNSGDDTRATTNGDTVGGTVLTTDQRGGPFVRSFGGTVDMGAFESQVLSPALFVVDNAIDEFDGDYSAGDRSLREMIDLANANAGQDVVTFVAALNGTPLLLTLGQMAITESVSLTGNGRSQTIVDAQAMSRVFYITGSGNVSISGMTLRNGNASGAGGAILFDSVGTLALDQTTLADNSGNEGGALYIVSGSVDIVDSTLSGNTADGHGGGAIYIDTGTLVVASSTFTNNHGVGTAGGALYINDGDVTITTSTLSGNSAASSGGGAIYFDNGTLTIESSVLTDNHALATSSGGAIYHDAGTLSLRNVTISGNTAGGTGGGIFTYTHDALTRLEIYDSVIDGNSARDGGGLYFSRHDPDDSVLLIHRSTISGNSATRNGGGVYLYSGEAFLANVTLSGNSAGEAGGGLFAHDDGHYPSTLTAVNVTVTGNRADSNDSVTGMLGDLGGGIFLKDDAVITVTLFNTIVAGNLFGTAAPLANDIVCEGAKTIEAASAHNLIGDPGTAGGLMDGVNGNIVGLGGLTIDVSTILAPLAPSGGGGMTHALVADSPALNAGDNALALDELGHPLTSDQRGNPFFRIFGAAVDIGAFEAQSLQSILGGVATFAGTDGDDQFVADIAAATVIVNNVLYVLPVDVVDVQFDGLLGTDTLNLLGTSGDEEVRLLPGQAFLDRSSLGVTGAAQSMEIIVFHGQGGADELTFFDSAGNDRFVGRLVLSRMVGAGYDNFARNVATVIAQSTAGGRDTAFLFDTAGDDTFTASATTATISGSGRTANGFDVVVGYASVGDDKAILTGTAARDVFVARPRLSSLSGGGIALLASRFERVIANARGGDDVARMFGRDGSADVFSGGPGQATLSGDVFQYTANGFETVLARAIGAGDVATLQDSAGDDTFLGDGSTGTLTTPNAVLSASGFSQITIRGTNGGTNRRNLIPPLAFTLIEPGTWS